MANRCYVKMAHYPPTIFMGDKNQNKYHTEDQSDKLRAEILKGLDKNKKVIIDFDLFPLYHGDGVFIEKTFRNLNIYDSPDFKDRIELINCAAAVKNYLGNIIFNKPTKQHDKENKK